MRWGELEAKYGKKKTEVKGWKHFLKLDRKKIVTFIVIIILGFLYRTPPYSSLMILTYIINLAFMFILYTDFFNTDILIFIGLILIFLYWYLLSCLMTWIYDKLKKKISRWYLLAIGGFVVILFILLIFICPPGYKRFQGYTHSYCASHSQKPCNSNEDCPENEECVSIDGNKWFCTGAHSGTCYFRIIEIINGTKEYAQICID